MSTTMILFAIACVLLVWIIRHPRHKKSMAEETRQYLTSYHEEKKPR